MPGTNPAKVIHLGASNRPPDTVKTVCAKCGSEATRAVYQHAHDPAVITYEVPAYSKKKGEAPVEWQCPCGAGKHQAVLIKCAACGNIARAN